MKKIFSFTVHLLVSSIAWAQFPASLDPSFNIAGTASYPVPMLTLPQISCKHLVQSDGKIVICSNSVISLGVTEIMVTRLNSNGSLDLSFGNSGTFTHSIVSGYNLAVGLVIQPDGKLVTSGIFNSGTGVNNNEVFILRLNTNGTLDNSFGTNGISTWNFSTEDERVTDLKLMPEGSFAISGYIQSQFLFPDSCFVIKTTPTGQLDNSFASNGMFRYQHNGSQTDLYALDVLTDKSIVAAGSFNSASNYQDVLAIKLDSTGSFDNSFATGGIYVRDVFNDYDEIHDLKILPNNDILLAGYSYDGNNDGSLVIKLNSTGTEITSFGNNGISSFVFANTPSRMYAMDVQTNGKIVLAGEYGDTISGLYDMMVLRLLANGTPDISFNNSLPYVTTDFLAEDDLSSSVVIQTDGKILVYGTAILNSFTLDDSPSLARYLGDITTAVGELTDESQCLIFPNPAHDKITILLNNNFSNAEFNLFDVYGKKIITKHFNCITREIIPVSDLRNGIYFYEIKNRSSVIQKGKLLIE